MRIETSLYRRSLSMDWYENESRLEWRVVQIAQELVRLWKMTMNLISLRKYLLLYVLNVRIALLILKRTTPAAFPYRVVECTYPSLVKTVSGLQTQLVYIRQTKISLIFFLYCDLPLFLAFESICVWQMPIDFASYDRACLLSSFTSFLRSFLWTFAYFVGDRTVFRKCT